MSVSELSCKEDEYISLLTHLLRHAAQLQNNPPHCTAQESLPAADVVDFLRPYSTEQGGPLEVRTVEYVKGRANVIIKYPGTDDKKVVSFVGAHLDVVPATPSEWKYDPFTVTQEGEYLYGRGVTDCMGHVAMLTLLLRDLAKLRPALKSSIVVVFIANEEASAVSGVGIDELERQGELKDLKHGPLFWVDSADIGPTLGTGAAIDWEMEATGKLFHSGVPQLAINAAELVWEAVRHVQKKFHEKYAPHFKEKEYLFKVGSSMKPTQMATPPGSSLNQIPGNAVIRGDMRMTPFFDIDEVKGDVQRWVDEINNGLDDLPKVGYSRFELPDEGLKGSVSVKFPGEPYKGVAVDMNSVGYKSLFQATETVFGEAKPFSLTGSLPIIADLQKSGYDVQVCGYGDMKTYHAKDEKLLIPQMLKGFKTFALLIDLLEQQ